MKSDGIAFLKEYAPQFFTEMDFFFDVRVSVDDDNHSISLLIRNIKEDDVVDLDAILCRYFGQGFRVYDLWYDPWYELWTQQNICDLTVTLTIE